MTGAPRRPSLTTSASHGKQGLGLQDEHDVAARKPAITGQGRERLQTGRHPACTPAA